MKTLTVKKFLVRLNKEEIVTNTYTAVKVVWAENEQEAQRKAAAIADLLDTAADEGALGLYFGLDDEATDTVEYSVLAVEEVD
jgi:hypothetical protein